MTGLTTAAVIALTSASGIGQGPTFDCAKAKGEVEQLICKDAALAALDRKLDGVYKAASTKASKERPPTLRAEQRGWIGGRNECWKAANIRVCVEGQYQMRIAELQAKYQLVPSSKPAFYACQNNPANEVVATFFETDPPAVRLERGDRTVLAFQVAAASGAKYEGQNVMFWNKGSETSVSWMNLATGETEELQCKVRP